MEEVRRVLVVDDDKAIRSTVAEILASIGYCVAEAADGVQALEELSRQTVDAVVLDVRMPYKDGIAVVYEMVPEPPPPGVVLVSAYDIDIDVRSALGDRVVRVLRKPAAPLDLIDAVGEAVEVASSSRKP